MHRRHGPQCCKRRCSYTRPAPTSSRNSPEWVHSIDDGIRPRPVSRPAASCHRPRTGGGPAAALRPSPMPERQRLVLPPPRPGPLECTAWSSTALPAAARRTPGPPRGPGAEAGGARGGAGSAVGVSTPACRRRARRAGVVAHSVTHTPVPQQVTGPKRLEHMCDDHTLRSLDLVHVISSAYCQFLLPECYCCKSRCSDSC